MCTLEIRQATTSDVALVKRLENASFGVDSYTHSFFRQSIELFGDSFLVACEGTGLVGYVLASRIPSSLDIGWILSVGVLPAQRRCGVGTQLTNRILARFREQRVRSVKLSVAPNNEAALAMYRRIGFQDLGVRRNYFGDGEDRIIMETRL